MHDTWVMDATQEKYDAWCDALEVGATPDECICGPDETGEAPECRIDCPEHGIPTVPTNRLSDRDSGGFEPPF